MRYYLDAFLDWLENGWPQIIAGTAVVAFFVISWVLAMSGAFEWFDQTAFLPANTPPTYFQKSEAMAGGASSGRIDFQTLTRLREGEVKFIEVGPLGTNDSGQDIAREIIKGFQTYMFYGPLVVLIVIGGGTLLGGVAAFFGGWFDVVYIGFTRIFTIVPRIVLLVIIAKISGFSLTWIVLGIAITNLPKIAHMVYDRIKSLKFLEYTEASREIGVPPTRILFRQLIWVHCKQLLASQMSYAMADFVLYEAFMSYLGMSVIAQNLGFHPWGTLVSTARDFILNPVLVYQLVFPTMAVTSLIFAFYLLGDGLNARFARQENS